MREREWTLSLGEATATTCGAETLAKFVTETETYEQPSIVSATTEGHFSVVAVDSLVAVVRDQCICNIKFNSTIDDLDILPGGYIAVGERSGVLTVGILDGDNQFNHKLSCMVIPEANRSTGKTFVNVSFQIIGELKAESRAQIICLSHEGHLITLSDIILENGEIDFSCVKQGKVATPLDKVFDFATLQNQIITVGSSPLCVASYSMVDGQALLKDTASWDSEESVDMVKIQMLASASVFVTLDSKGKFYIWDMYTMTVVHTWTVAGVTDFRLIQGKIAQSFRLSDLKLLVAQHGKVQTLTLPTLAVSSEYTTGADFADLSKSSISQDEVYVAECIKVDDYDCVETTVYFRCYTEINPLKRLQRLIAKRRYEEAEKFAKLYGLPFNLDPEIVQSKMREVQESFAEAVKHIGQCKEQLLRNKSQDSSVTAVLAELLELEHRLEAYRLVYGEENYSPSEWETFQYDNPLTMCWKLVMVDAEKAFKLWACFQEDLQKQLKPGLLHQMLQRIPASVPCQTVVDWLSQAVVPYIVTSDPDAVGSIIQWVENQIQILEMNGKALWINDAIQVCRSMLESLELAVACDVDDTDYSDLQALKAKMNCGKCLSPLKALIKLLNGLNELKTKFRCHLTLGAFKKETKESIAYRMLDGVLDVNLLPAVLNGQVLPYLKHHRIDHDGVFAKYIQDLLERSDASHLHHLWEDKVKALIKVICDPKAKVTAALNLLDRVMLPLPEFVEGLVAEVIATVQHPLVTSLKEKWNIKEAENILVMYGLDQKEVNSAFDAREATKIILANGGSYSQAQKILLAHKVSEDDAQLPIFQCTLIIERNQVDRLIQFLKKLPREIARLCCDFVINNAKCLMAHDSFSEQHMKAVRLRYYEAALISSSFLKSLIDDLPEIEEIDKMVQIIKNAWSLEIYKSVCVNDVVLGDKVKCRNIFSNLAAETSNSTDLIGLGRLLNLTDGEILEATISACAKKSSSEIVAKMLQQLAALYGSCRSLPIALIDNVFSVTDVKNLTCSQCLTLAQLYVSHCSDADKLKAALQVCQQAYLFWDASIKNKGSLSTTASDTLDLGYFHEGVPSSGLLKRQPDVTESLFVVLGDDEPLEDILLHLERLIDELRKAERLQLALWVLLLLSTRIEAVTTFLPSEEKQYCVDIVMKMTSMAQTLAASVVTKILNTVPVDILLAEAHVLMLPKEQSVTLLHNVIRSCLSNYPKLKRVNAVACATAEILGDQKLIEGSQKIQVLAKWGNRLSKIGIPFKSSALTSISEAMEAVHKLIQNPHCNIDIIIEFFSDFNLDACQLNTAFMQFFEVCLTVHSEDKLTPAALRKAEDALQFFKGDALKILKKVLQETHPYNYEVLQFLLEKIQEREDSRETLKGLELLRYLYNYKRCSAPCGVERKKFSCVLDENGEHGHSSLPDAAAVRLPFHLLQCKDSVWEVISAEINPHNLSLWLDIAPVLTISRTSILLRASTNITENHIKTSTSSNEAVSLEFSQVLNKVDSILSQVEEREKGEKAMWWLHTFNKLAHVGEKTLALEQSLRHAKQWMKSATEPQQMERAKKSVEMFSKKLQLYSSLWALCRAGLDKEKELTKLIKEPEELIQRLYLMPCVVDDDQEGKTDMNALCDEIADLNGTNLLDVRRTLLDKWLLGSSLVDQDQTLTFDGFLENSEVDLKDSVKRALYMMESRDRNDLLQHVAAIANMVDVTVNSAAHKRALYCLLNIATKEEIVDLLVGET